MKHRMTAIFVVLAIIAIASIVLLSFFSRILVQWLWMDKLDYGVIFWKSLLLRVAISITVFASVFSVFLLNSCILIRRVFHFNSEIFVHLGDPGGRRLTVVSEENLLPFSMARLIAFASSLAFAFLFAMILQNTWDVLLRYIWREPFGETDPVYGLDIGFYLFELPFYEIIQNSLSALFLILLAATALIYIFLDRIRLEKTLMTSIGHSVLAHVSILAILFLLSFAAGYLLDRYQLLYSAQGTVYGMGYTDYHVVRIGLWVMTGATLMLAGILGLNVFVRSLALLVASVGGFALLAFVVMGIVPFFVGKFIVQPNELQKELPFIENNIAMTRKAYMLDKIREIPYASGTGLTSADIRKNRDTIGNIRLWDWRPILQTYQQAQEIRLYYHFYQVDVDRYHLPGAGYRQVMLSARELSEELPERARTWVNRYLQFTHGYGLAMSFVSEAVAEGLPRYVIQGIVPDSEYLEVTRPEIYYPEKALGHRIVNTGIAELDYPRGDGNVYTRYQGSGGLPMDGFWKRLLFAWHVNDINILISGYILPSSRIQLWRNTEERVSRIAPFLVLDQDPYLVVSRGRLYWIQDAYTVSDRYPYAEPYQNRLNYIRNSVKAVVDAYDGSVALYVFHPEDPVIRVYQKAFPGVFRRWDELPGHLLEHVRYPEDLFTAQMYLYRTYHMRVPQVFYNQEDLWTFPQEKYAGESIEMQPYYILMRLPGEERLQYIMLLPFTPQDRKNMIAWAASRSDFPRYGEIVVYTLPKQRIFYGPEQIEAMIDQDDVISQQLSLWDQRGSRVIRGNLLVIPLETSFLYVEPVFLIAEGTNLPQLKRVIMVYGQRVVMAPTIPDAVNALFGKREARREAAEEEQGAPPEIREDVLDTMQQAEQALARGDWSGFGRAMDRLREILNRPAGEEATGR